MAQFDLRKSEWITVVTDNDNDITVLPNAKFKGQAGSVRCIQVSITIIYDITYYDLFYSVWVSYIASFILFPI